MKLGEAVVLYVYYNFNKFVRPLGAGEFSQGLKINY